MDSLFSDNYIQHSPRVKDGKSRFLEFLEKLQKLPKPENTSKPFYRYIVDDNFVAVHLQIEFLSNEYAVLDLFRLENGKIAEHWDASELIDSSTNTIEAVKGTVEIKGAPLTAKNKELAKAFVQEVLINRSVSFQQFVGLDLKSHMATEPSNKARSISDYSNFNYKKYHKLIGNGNFVVTQSEAL